MKVLFPQDIHVGMKVYHLLIQQNLKIVEDEKGPAYTGKQFRDDEISFSNARSEAEFGYLMTSNY